MGLSWQQGPLAPGAVGRFLVPGPLPERMLFAEPLRRRLRVRFGGAWIADSEAAHRELSGRGVTVSGIRHKSPIDDWKGGWQSGADPERRDYASFADFADPDGNTWVIQEIGYRPPRGASATTGSTREDSR
jgi:hypothetical protein